MSRQKNVHKVEYYRCWNDLSGMDTGTWDTDFIEIKCDLSMSQEALDKAVRKAIAEFVWDPQPPAMVGFYTWVPEDDEENE